MFTKHDLRVGARGPGFQLWMTLHGNTEEWPVEEVATSANVLKHTGSGKRSTSILHREKAISSCNTRLTARDLDSVLNVHFNKSPPRRKIYGMKVMCSVAVGGPSMYFMCSCAEVLYEV